MENISFLPVCSDWQEERCRILGIKFVVGKHCHHSDPSIMKVSQAPAVTERIKGDGNCFFFLVNCSGCNWIPTGSPRIPPPFNILHDT